MGDWAEHLLWYNDGRFAKHPYFKFVLHNMIMRKKVLEHSSFIVKQKLGDQHFTISDLKKLIENGDTSICQKKLYFGGSIRGTTQYWGKRAQELRALVQFKINEGMGLPSFLPLAAVQISTLSHSDDYFLFMLKKQLVHL